MKRTKGSLTLVLMVFFLSSSCLAQDSLIVVRLKSGGKLVGRIVERIEDRSIRVRVDNAREFTVAWDNILEILDNRSQSTQPATSISSKRIQTPTVTPSIQSIARDSTWQIMLRSGILLRNISLDSLRGGTLFVTLHRVEDTVKLSPTTRMLEVFAKEKLSNPNIELRAGTNIRQVEALDLSSIAAIYLDRESHVWSYAVYGVLIGSVSGALMGLALYEKPTEPEFLGGPGWSAFGGGIYGTLLGFLVGGGIGASLGEDIVIELDANNNQGSLRALQEIFRRQ